MRLLALLSFAAMVACMREADPPPRPPTGPPMARAAVFLKNQMGNGFRLVSVSASLDGFPLATKNEEAIGDQVEIALGEMVLHGGERTLAMHARLRGNGYGVFSYLKGYTFDVRSSHVLTAIDHARVVMRCTLYEKGGATTPLEERPAIACTQKSEP